MLDAGAKSGYARRCAERSMGYALGDGKLETPDAMAYECYSNVGPGAAGISFSTSIWTWQHSFESAFPIAPSHA